MSTFFINVDTLEYPLHISQVNRANAIARATKKDLPNFEPIKRVQPPAVESGVKLIRGPAVKTNDGWEESWLTDAYTQDELTAISEKKALANRQTRDMLLRASDWTQLQDSPVDKQAWRVYRQQLRDLPSSAEWPEVTWPEKPAA